MKKKHHITNNEYFSTPAELMQRQARNQNTKKVSNAIGAGIFILVGLSNLLFALPFEDSFDYVHLAIALSNLGLSTVWIKDAITASKNQKLFAEQAQKANNEESSEQTAPQA